MQAPQSPIDIKIVMGDDYGCQNLINLDIDFSENPDQVKSYLLEKNLPEQYGAGFAMLFDFHVQPGRQGQAIKYFDANSQGKSPLQILFNLRPDPYEYQKCIFEMTAHEKFIRLLYKFNYFKNQQAIKQILEIFEAGGVQMQSHINIQLKGSIAHIKNNRTHVLVDYNKFHFISNVFCSQKFFTTLSTFNEIKNNAQYYIKNPFFQLIKKAKVAKIDLKMDSSRKLAKFYNKVSGESNQVEKKQFKYVNQGIFRQKMEAALIYHNKYLIKIVGKYQSQDAFIRLVKVYAKFFIQAVDLPVYDDL